MECIFGIQFKTFVIIVADTTIANSVVVMKNDANKLYKLSEKIVMAVCGARGDTIQFAEFIDKNIKLYKIRNGYELSPGAVATYTRKKLADTLRSPTPYQVNLLLAGYDNETGPVLYYIDYLGTCVKVPHASHGYGGLLSLAIMDKYHVEEMTEEAAYDIAVKCVKELHQRFVINLPKFKIQLIDKHGIKRYARHNYRNYYNSLDCYCLTS